MDTLILGTGAMAKLFGARLQRAGVAEVSLAGSWSDALRAISREGLRVEEPSEQAIGERGRTAATWSAAVSALHRDEIPSAAFDLVLVLVKSYQTAAVASIAARGARLTGLVLTLQNGIGNRELLEACGGARVTAGVTSAGATGLGPNRVRAGGPGQTLLGRPVARTGDAEVGTAPSDMGWPRIEDLVRRFRAAGFSTELAEDIDGLLWRKLAVNAAINPLTALHGLPNGGLLEDPELRARMRLAASEVATVAAAKGIDPGSDVVAFAEEVARKTAGNRSSMLQDVDRGARTEIDAICGAVLREGQALGIPTPVNAELWAAVSALAPSPTRSVA